MGSIEKLKVMGVYHFKCFGKHGRLKWEDTASNLITIEGRNHILNAVFHGETQVATWYLGLKNAGTVAAADTLASHAGWAENTNYSGDRKELDEAASTTGIITNSANVAEFTLDTDEQTISGGILASAATGTSGILMSAADFDNGDKTGDSGDIIRVSYTLTLANI